MIFLVLSEKVIFFKILTFCVNMKQLHLMLMWIKHCTKKHTFLSQMFRKMIFPKSVTVIWSSLYYQKKWFFFPKNMLSLFRLIFLKKNKQIKKNTWTYEVFFKCSKKIFFPKNSHWNVKYPCSSFVISGKMIFLFSRNYDIFSLDGKWRMVCLKKYMEIC